MWWRIFHAPNASEWCNVLVLTKLLFSLPASNEKLEKVFSQVNVIKTKKRTLLSNNSLDDLTLTSDHTPTSEGQAPYTFLETFRTGNTVSKASHQSSQKLYHSFRASSIANSIRCARHHIQKIQLSFLSTRPLRPPSAMLADAPSVAIPTSLRQCVSRASFLQMQP